MRIDPAVPVAVEWTVAQAIEALATTPDPACVVVVGDGHCWVLDAATLRGALADADPKAALGAALQVEPSWAARVTDRPDDEQRLGDVVRRGGRVLGVVVADESAQRSTRPTTGSTFIRLPTTPAIAGSEPRYGFGPPRQDRPRSPFDGPFFPPLTRPHTDREPSSAADPSEPLTEPLTGQEAPGAGVGSANGEEAEGRRPVRERLRAYSDLTGPARAQAEVPFQVTAGFAAAPRPDDPSPEPVIVADAPEQVPFVVQVCGFGLRFPDGVRRDLVVPRDAPTGGRVSFTVVADPVHAPFTRTVEVSFEYAGELCGHAWLDVVVEPATATPAPPAQDAPAVVALAENAPEQAPAVPAPADPERGPSGSSGVAVGAAGPVPTLTVEIRSQPGTGTLEWVLHPRDEVPRPEGKVTSQLDAPSARAFAEQLMAVLPGSQGAGWVSTTLRGAGRRVARAMPPEYWTMLEATWRATPAGQVPSLLLTTDEPYVPWELAWVDDKVVDPALLPPEGEGPLGALWRVGRWVPPVRAPRPPETPASPPDPRIDVTQLAVVVGQYTGKIPELPHAVTEGATISQAYGALSLAADEEAVTELLAGTLQEQGKPFHPDVLHFACHGEVSLGTQQFTGLLLQGGRRLDLLTVEGSELGEAGAPFVFLNACEVGTASTVLSEYGGLAGAFLLAGCRGFVAPLWKVNDEVAGQIAVDFYAATLAEGLPVGEAVRRARARFREGGTPAVTALAYVLYAHPDLVLTRTTTT